MRKNHHGKNDRLVKRVFALCLALAVICTCLVPVFATEDLSDLQVEKGASQPVDDEGGEEEAAGSDGDSPAVDDSEAAGSDGDSPAVDDSEAAGSDGDSPAVDDSEAAGPDGDSPAVDDSEAAGSDGDSPAVDDSEVAGPDGEEAPRPVDGEGGEDNPGEGGEDNPGEGGEDNPGEGGEDNPGEGGEDNPGEDAVVDMNEEVVSGDEIKKLQDMVVYRFWLKELNADDLQDIATKAQNDNMTESEYLAQNGEVWKLYFIQAVPRAETIADYSSYIKDPSSNQDPKGELRPFDYWYTLDELGNRVRLDLSDPTSNILDDKTTTVNVYAAWQDGTVGSDEEEDVVHEDLVDKNPAPPAPVELTAKASYEGEGDNTESVDLPVKVTNLPSAAHSLSVIHMGGEAMQTFYTSHPSDFEGMRPLLGLKITPEDINSEKVQPAKGDVATVTVSDLDKLPEIVAMEKAGALTADALKVLHQKADGSVETLDVLTYTNGTLTFETSSFSPFVIALAGGYDSELLDERKTNKDWYDKAGLYIMYDPEKNPDSNDTTMWTGVVTVGTEHAKLGDLNGAKWTEDRNIFFRDIVDGADGDTAKQYIKYWPDGTQYTGPRVLAPDDSSEFRQIQVAYGENHATHDTLENMIFEMYKGKLVTMYTDNGYSEAQAKDIVKQLKASDITFTITPHKISKDNWESDPTNPRKHIDCTVTVTCDKTFTAKFNVKKPGESGYTTVNSKLYLWKDNEANTVIQYVNDDTVPHEINEKDGVKWAFDGWYPENIDGTGPDLTAKPIPNTDWPYTVQEYQLTNYGNDRVVNFYAHYKKATSNVTITKQVTGLLGDTNKEFTFNVSITQNGADCTGVTAKKGDQTVPDLNNFTLKHNETVTLENVPIGATIKVTEVTPGEHYKVSATEQNGERDGSSDVTFIYVAVANTATASDAGEAVLMLLSMDEDTTVDADAVALADANNNNKVPNNAITVTNHCALEPDTGVLLDTLPYIVILAVVAGGVALLMLRKRRKEDD